MSEKSDELVSFVRTLMVKSYPKSWQRLWEDIYSVSQSVKIAHNASLEVFKLVYGCVTKEEEGRPVSTGFLVGDAEKLMECLPESADIQLDRKYIGEASDRLRHLFGLIDGVSSIFVIGKDGMVEDARLLPIERVPTSEESYASCDFASHCNSLSDAPAYGLLALGGYKTAKFMVEGSVRSEVYFSGKTGDWTYRSIAELSRVLDEAASAKGIKKALLHKMLGVAINMSNHRKGGTMVIGDSEAVLRQSEPPRLKLKGANILKLMGPQERHLYNLATQEFGLVIGKEGDLVGASVRFLARVPDNVHIDVTPSDGGRHRSACEISACADAISFVVSDDGPITVYMAGKRIARV